MTRVPICPLASPDAFFPLLSPIRPRAGIRKGLATRSKERIVVELLRWWKMYIPIFNWIGFFLSFYCFSYRKVWGHFSIWSLIKWILTARFSIYFLAYFDSQYWLWWVFLVLGFLFVWPVEFFVCDHQEPGWTLSASAGWLSMYVCMYLSIYLLSTSIYLLMRTQILSE